MPETKVLDSWALLAWLLDQPAAAHVQSLLNCAELGEIGLSMSWINAGEVYYMTARKRGPAQAEEFLARLPSLPLRLVSPDADGIISAAKLKSKYRISYADAFAAALAMRDSAVLVTGDPELRTLIETVSVEWIGAS